MKDKEYLKRNEFQYEKDKTQDVRKCNSERRNSRKNIFKDSTK